MTRIAIFASGAGSNAEKIIQYFKNHTSISIQLIVVNVPGAGVISIAEKENIPFVIIEKEQFFRGTGYLPELKKHKINFIVLAGFLWKIPEVLIGAYPSSIINIHPALLPNYGGKGMYGMNVHRAVIRAGDKKSGITIHYVDEQYDNGDVIFQEACSISDEDTPESLAAKIQALEHAYYPKIVEQVVELQRQR
ncbi:MAG: phosphoribosylglycinamide formyltransferase [Flavitalea sp.]